MTGALRPVSLIIEKTMRKVLLFFMLTALTCSTASANFDTEKEIRAAVDRFITAFNNLNWPVFHQALDDDVTVFNPDIPETTMLHRLDGREQVESAFAAVFTATKQKTSGPPYLHIDPRNLRIQLYGSMAIVTFEFERDGGSFGRRTLVLHRATQGKWKIVHIHASNVNRGD